MKYQLLSLHVKRKIRIRIIVLCLTCIEGMNHRPLRMSSVSLSLRQVLKTLSMWNRLS